MKPSIVAVHVGSNASGVVSGSAGVRDLAKRQGLLGLTLWSALAMVVAVHPAVVAAPRLSPGAGPARTFESASSRLPDLGPAPELAGISSWINGPPRTLASLRGRVVLVKFWTFSCINCRHTLPATRSWYERYHPKGFEIIAVHTPELDSERRPENVAAAVKRQAIAYPVALDPDFATWNTYRNHYWPAVYLVDAKGRIRYTHIGEGDYAGTERAIRELLAERNS